ncbi:MAG: Sialidase precursor [Planctomycetota bacterium]|jgi:predicted neuraminidase
MRYLCRTCFRARFSQVAAVFLVLPQWLALAAAQNSSPYFQTELVFPRQATHNHAPGIAQLANGDLIVSWYRGSGERQADDVQVLGARRASGSVTWSESFLMADTPGFPDCNTAMLADSQGRLFLFWPVILANTWESCLTHVRVCNHPEQPGPPRWDRTDAILLKPDDFSAAAVAALDEQIAQLPPLPEKTIASINETRQRLSQKLYQRLGWQPRCKPTVLPSGRILLPLYSDTFSLSLMAISDDGGQTWFAGKPMLGFGAIQPAVLRKSDGTLVAFMRENGFTETIRRAESRDDGVTWGPVTSAGLPNPGSGLDGVRLGNGRWLLVYNDTTNGRNSLAVSLSDDEGDTWTVTRRLEDRASGSYHYPTVIQTKDGRIHVVYSTFTDEGKSMQHAEFDEGWLSDGQ